MDKKSGKRLCSMLIGERLRKDVEISGSSEISYDTDYPLEISTFLLCGAAVEEKPMSGRYHSPGFLEDGSYKINMRVRGKTILDGREFERILKERDSPIYGGTVGEDSFVINIKSDKEYPLITTEDIKFPNGSFVFSADCMLDEPQDNLSAGIQAKYMSNGSLTAKLEHGDIYENSFKLQYMFSNKIYGLYSKPSAEDFSYVVPYDSMRLYKGTRNDEPYIGYTIKLDVGEGLYRLPGNGISDTYDLVAGILTRKVAKVSFSSLDIREAKYEGVSCFTAELPIKAKAGCDIYNDNFYTRNHTLYEDDSCSMFLDPTGERIFFIRDVGDTLEDIKAYFAENDSDIFYERNVHIIENKTAPQIKPPSGKFTIEVCSSESMAMYIEFKT